ncbi:MAG TPA: hypothetical protein VJ842_04180 [Pyrinomonadaceae bacterium]|nr:hypothetical protein [Pyrinomonadaceae bacterium]
MRRTTSNAFILLLLAQLCPAQSPATTPSTPRAQTVVAKIPDGTIIEIATANTIDSADVKVGDIVSFRVLKALKIEGATVIEEGALATGRVSKANRGRPFGKAGQLAWEMREVVAANGQTIPLAFAETRKGRSKGGTVATAAVITAVMFPLAAPVALLWGFKRGKSAVLPAGTVLQVVTRGDATLTLDAPR